MLRHGEISGPCAGRVVEVTTVGSWEYLPLTIRTYPAIFPLSNCQTADRRADAVGLGGCEPLQYLMPPCMSGNDCWGCILHAGLL